MTHTELQELLGAYALDAVDDHERDAVALHLDECPRCRAEVASHRNAAAALAFVGAAAPAGLWDRIAGELEETPPELQLTRLVPASASAATRRTLLPRVAAAACVAVLVGVLGVKVVSQDQRIDQLVALVNQDGFEKEIAAASVDPGARRVHLTSPDGTHEVEAVLRPDGRGYLVVHNLPELPQNQTYQLWGQVDNRLVSLGVLGNAPGTSAFEVRADVGALAVTAEVAGGVERSSNKPVVVGLVPGIRT